MSKRCLSEFSLQQLQHKPSCFICVLKMSGMQMVALELFTTFNCFPVFLGSDLKDRYYKGVSCFVPLHRLFNGFAAALTFSK